MLTLATTVSPLSVCFACSWSGYSTTMTSTRVFIGRLPNIARESDVERFFKGYGKIREISLKEGYGFVVSSCQLS